MTFAFLPAEQCDDAPIRTLLANNPMPGDVTVAFEREPDYFLGHGIMGDRCTTIKAVDISNGKIVAVVCVASANRFVGGSVKPVGYIGQLRIDASYRGYLLPLRAMSFIHEWIDSGWPDTWIAVFADNNPEAYKIFITKPRPSLPSMELVSRVHTLAILTSARTSSHSSRDKKKHPGEIRRGDEIGLPLIVDFLQEQAQKREFFPWYSEDHFDMAIRSPGFSTTDFLVCFEGGDIAGVCGVWDQSSFKQTVVRGYRGLLKRARPLINLAAPISGIQRLPGVGEEIQSAYLSFLAVRENNTAIFHTLLRSAVQAAHAMGKSYLLAGFAEGDPFLAVALRFRHISYRSTMFAFNFAGVVPTEAFYRGKIPYVDVATL